MRKTFPMVILLAAFLGACKTESPKESENPFFESYNTPFGVPPFDKITNEHFIPAMEAGMKQQLAEIDSIVSNTEAPTFANTVEAFEKSGGLLNRVNLVFYNLNSAHTNDTIQAIAEEMAPVLSKHSDDIMLNARLFARLKMVNDQKASLNLTPEQARLLDETYKKFVRSGANLDSAKQVKLRELNSQLSVLTVQFGQNLLAETNAFQLFIDKKEDLAGLPQGLMDAAAEEATAAGKQNQWLFTLQNPSIMPFLQYSANRALRKKMLEAYLNRGNNNNANDTKKVIARIVDLRVQRAQLLGYPTHADYVLEITMAKNPANVYTLLNQLWTPALMVAEKEAGELQQLIVKEDEKFTLEASDWRYYAEKLRKEKYDLDEEALKPYFKLENVRDGIFFVANKLYGLTFAPIDSIPVYHPDVVAYEVKEADGSSVGVLYLDFHPRASKRGGAWMTNFRNEKYENGQRLAPVISIVCNFTKPTANTPSLLTLDEVTTFFHEFGHALHGLLANTTYESLSGTSVPSDFVELPSQIMENWAVEPQVLKIYAKHYQTGQVMPDDLIAKIEKSSQFNQGFATVEYLAASLLDMDYHTQKAALHSDIPSFEKASMDKIGLISQIPPRYRSTYFNHIWGGGYSAGYYSYIWAEVLDADAFNAFKESGDIFNPERAKAFRTNVLEKGGTEDPMVLYKRFRGTEPSIDPLLKRRGLK